MLVYIEGGSDTNGKVNAEFRHAFHEIFSNAGITKPPKVIMAKAQMVGKFVRSYKKDNDALLLLDSEMNVKGDEDKTDALRRFIQNVKKRKDWDENSDEIPEDRIHFMVACMESWFIADVDTIQTYFGIGKEKIQDWQDVEIIDKDKILDTLKKIAGESPKKKYSKTRDATKLLRRTNPLVVKEKAYFCDRFLKFLINYS